VKISGVRINIAELQNRIILANLSNSLLPSKSEKLLDEKYLVITSESAILLPNVLGHPSRFQISGISVLTLKINALDSENP
jgi:hypothetical protein